MFPRGRGRGRVNNRTRAVQAVRNLERRITGHKTVPANNPPAFVQRPWNSWTFEKLETTTSNLQTVTITVNDIVNNIRSRGAIGVTGNQIQLKVLSSQIWCTASSLTYPDLEAAFFELQGEVPTTQNVRSLQRDKGTLNMPAKAGFMFPSADRRDIVGDLGPSINTLRVCSGTATNTGSNLTFRVQVLWQTLPLTS